MKNKFVIGSGALALLVVAVVVLNRAPEGNGSLVDEPPHLEASASSRSPLAVSKMTTGVAERGRAAAAESTPIPEVTQTQPAAAEVDLWQLDQNDPDTSFDGNPAKRLQADPDVIAALQVGQRLHLQIPQRGTAVEAHIASTHNLTPRTQIWQGKILDGHPQDNIVVTRGQLETHVTISTYDGTYSAVIDNTTGSTVMVDEGDINANQIPHEDGIPIDPVEHQPPAVEH